MIRDFVRYVLESPQLESDVVAALIERFVEVSRHEMPIRHVISRTYGGRRVPGWGAYVPDDFTLVVRPVTLVSDNDVIDVLMTVLHEIEHYNQHVRMADELPSDCELEDIIDVWSASYGSHSSSDYDNNALEISAEYFAEQNIDEALEIYKSLRSRKERHTAPNGESVGSSPTGEATEV